MRFLDAAIGQTLITAAGELWRQALPIRERVFEVVGVLVTFALSECLHQTGRRVAMMQGHGFRYRVRRRAVGERPVRVLGEGHENRQDRGQGLDGGGRLVYTVSTQRRASSRGDSWSYLVSCYYSSAWV